MRRWSVPVFTPVLFSPLRVGGGADVGHGEGGTRGACPMRRRSCVGEIGIVMMMLVAVVMAMAMVILVMMMAMVI